jgi:hypothetical protein
MAEVMLPWFNAYIEIINPDISGSTFDRATNTKTRTTQTIWQGPARIQAMRWPNVATARQEAVAARTVVFHIPLSDDVFPDLIHEGWRVHVVDGGMSPEFEGGLFVVTAAINSSYAWDRRIETIQDMGATIT